MGDKIHAMVLGTLDALADSGQYESDEDIVTDVTIWLKVWASARVIAHLGVKPSVNQ